MTTDPEQYRAELAAVYGLTPEEAATYTVPGEPSIPRRHDPFEVVHATLDPPLAELARLHDVVIERTTALGQAREARDAYIRRLSQEGVTAYRMASVLPISEQAVGKIIRASA